MESNRGFTLVELLVVIGVIAVLAAVVLVAVNPGRQFAQARDGQRRSDLYSLTNAIYQFAVEHNGELPETATVAFPSNPTCIGNGGSCFDLANAGEVNLSTGVVSDTIVPTYLSTLPVDPSNGTETNTGYIIYENTDGRVVASASGEISNGISIVR